MKKLLLGLGAIASVAAPVAAVVACGSTTDTSLEATKKGTVANLTHLTNLTSEQIATATANINKAKTATEATAAFTAASVLNNAAAAASGSTDDAPKTGDAATKSSIIELLKSKGYTITTAQGAKIVNALFANDASSTDKSFKFGRIEAGKKVDGVDTGTDTSTHDSDDFLIVVNGGTQKTKTGPTNNLLDLTGKDAVKNEWGTFTTADFKDATSIIYLHRVDHTKDTNPGSDDSWITVNPVVKDGSAIKEVEGTPVKGLGIVQIKISGAGHEDFPNT